MLSDELKDQIQGAYRQFLAARSLGPRRGQRQMIAEVARVFANVETDEEGRRTSSGHIAVVEAGTGTGKTVAYLLAAVPVAVATGRTVVISTATVSLQEQLLHKDIPDVLAHAGLQFTVALAKGRGRYLCLSHLERLRSPADEAYTLSMFDDYRAVAMDRDSVTLLASMQQALDAGQWDGDRDSWPGRIPDELWRKVAAEYQGCTGRRCPFYESCCFYQARSGLQGARVIIANHDLVLSDLARGESQVLPAPDRCLYVFDEGHHLPDKALNHLACALPVRATQGWLKERGKWMDLAADACLNPVAAGWKNEFGELAPDLHEALDELALALRPWVEQADRLDGETGRWQRRLAGDQSVEELQPICERLSALATRLLRWNEGMQQFVSDCLDERRDDLSQADAEAWWLVVNSDRTRLETLRQVAVMFASPPRLDDPWARWLDIADGSGQGDVSVCTSPILPGPLLKPLLWDRSHAAVVTSATLSTAGNFDRFCERAGIPAEARRLEVDSPFDHASAATLWIADTPFAPDDGLRHSLLVVDTVVTRRGEGGTLVLFTSRRQLEEVHDMLPESLRASVLMQGNDSKQVLLETHRRRIDQGESSVLMGLASFSEGLDLPGDYCRTLIIARLPFAVPDAPVDAALAEFVESRGGKPFFDITVPDAALKLKQMTGRLLRTERDCGDIYLLDTRILRKSYGKRLLAALPPFRVQTFKP